MSDGEAVYWPRPLAARERVLNDALELIVGDRNQSYNDPIENFSQIASLWSTYLGIEVEPHDVAVLNILQKVSRMMTSPERMDHWTDIAGYAGCGYECVESTHGRTEADH